MSVAHLVIYYQVEYCFEASETMPKYWSITAQMGSDTLIMGSDNGQIGQYTISLLVTYRHLSEFHCLATQTVINLKVHFVEHETVNTED